ncbi:hypothetical protein [Arthrobacter woluwensis]|uniref:Uncharacterized protein n=1 Tax=Arthrobacter woluwensis TaxID=156980 RepID=A0A1H4I724_9MICC|nr:hypothetical protein [Arthrobacter woluwensis]SEB29877.1 hypothetical protein SAMN04489745_0089 [Arthrobacter woluwensis]
MILFYLSPHKNIPGHTVGEARILRTSRWWTCSDASLAEHGDFALAEEAGIIEGIYEIEGWRRDPNVNNKAVLDLSRLAPGHPMLAWVGRKSPIPRKRGARNNFRYMTIKGAAFTPDGLDWTRE